MDIMDITKLDLNWGGEGFPAYQGFLEDPPAGEGAGVMDSQDRSEAALAMFNAANSTADGANAAGGSQDGDQAAGDGSGTAGIEGPQDGQPDAAAGALTEEQLAADPRYQELSTFHDSIQPVLDEHGIPDSKELGLQLADSQVLYDIMQGKGSPAQLLDVMAQNASWSNEQKSAIAQNLIGWLTTNGYLKDGQGKPAAGADGQRKFDDPLADKVASLEKTIADGKTQQQTAERQAHQQTVFKNVTDKIGEFCKQKGVADPEDVGYYINQVAALVNGNPAVIGRVEKNNFVDIQRLFTQVHNAEVKRMSRFSAAQSRTQAGKAGNPKIPAGGAPPAPAGQPTRKLATNREEAAANSERRRQAAADLL